MLNLVSLAIGALALLSALFAFLPLLGWANWFVIPVAVVGMVLGMASRHSSGRNLNIVVIIVAVLRLSLGGGIF